MLRKIHSTSLSIPLVLLIGLLPYRLASVFHLEILTRIIIAAFSLIVLMVFAKNLIPRFLSTPFFQLFFYYFLGFENFVRSLPVWRQALLLFLVGLNLGLWPNALEDPFFYYSFILLFLSLYSQMKNIFLNPEVEGNIYSMLKEEELNELSWSQIQENISTLSLFLFQMPVVNQLGNSINKKQFPNMAKRYMWRRAVHTAITFPEISLISGTFGGLLGFGFSEWRNTQRHKELLTEQKRANDIADRQAEIAQNQTDLIKRQLVAQEKANEIALGNLSPSPIPKKPEAGCTLSCCLEPSVFQPIKDSFNFLPFF